MNKYLTAFALAIALPTMAHAQVAAAAPKAGCCDKMKSGCKMDCCKDMAKMDHKADGAKADPHAGHVMPAPAGGAEAPHNH